MMYIEFEPKMFREKHPSHLLGVAYQIQVIFGVTFFLAVYWKLYSVPAKVIGEFLDYLETSFDTIVCNYLYPNVLPFKAELRRFKAINSGKNKKMTGHQISVEAPKL